MQLPRRRPSDEELVRRVTRGDGDALGELFDRHYEPLVNSVVKILKDEDDARDAAAEAFLRAEKYSYAYKRHRGTFKSWLNRIAVRVAYDWLQTSRVTVSLDDLLNVQDDDGDHRDAEADIDTQARVCRAFRLLSPEDQLVLELLCIREMDTNVVAQFLGCKPGTLRQRKRRARNRLTERYGADEK